MTTTKKYSPFEIQAVVHSEHFFLLVSAVYMREVRVPDQKLINIELPVAVKTFSLHSVNSVVILYRLDALSRTLFDYIFSLRIETTFDA